ncbi:MAG: hypothetical protein HY721_10605, partial [Planctomycetes bacterium]|nr:hypothetical protein [Planctomycetota bacterium]
LLDAFRKTLAFLEDILRDSRVTEPSSLNLALTDGATTMVSRHGLGLAGPPLALHVARGVRYLPGRPPRFEPAAGGGGVLVASEPLFADPAWEEVPPDRIVLVRQGSGATLVELGS